MNKPLSLALARRALLSLLESRSLLGPLAVLAAHTGRLFRIPLPGFRPYVVSGGQANRHVLVTGRDRLRWRTTDPVTDLLGRGVLVTDGEEHDRTRALMEPPLHPSQLDRYAGMMIRQTDRVSSTWTDGAVVDMLVEGRRIALLIVMQALFSRDAWDDLPRIWTPVLKAIQFISPGPWIFWRGIPRPGFKTHLRRLDEYLFELIAARRAGPPGQDLLQHLVDAGLNDRLIRDQMLTLLIAGHDTSTALLAWTFALLGQHPDVHRRLVRDIDAGGKPALLDQVIKESLRLYPPIHIGNRRVVEGVDFEEGMVPAGERLFYSIYLTHRDPQVWQDADTFCPGRFSQGRTTPPFSYVPFGAGPRACMGAAFGLAEARIVIGRLLQTHTFEFTGHTILPHMGATLEPRPGVRMKVTRR